MSKSIHQTLLSVFRGKSKGEVNQMCNPQNLDHDVKMLRVKSNLKKTTKKERSEHKTAQQLDAPENMS